MARLVLHLDCRYYRGDKPCKYKRLCDGCPEYSPMGKRILIIKLAATGDVLRTTPVLPELHKKYAPCHITWVTDPAAYALLKNTDLIDRLLVLENPDTIPGLLVEQFDLLACLDKEPRATGLAMKISAKEKIGFGLNEFGTPYPLSESTDYAFQLGLDDPLKFRVNQKSYPEIIFEVFGLSWKRQPYYIQFPKVLYVHAEALRRKWKLKNQRVIGLNTGSGARFATKQWPIVGYVDLAQMIQQKYEQTAKILLLGGPEEKEKNKEIYQRCKTKGIPVMDTGCDNSLLDFCLFIELCDVLVTGDTLAMHLGIALKKQVIALFGSTCQQEIELYGRGKKIVVDQKRFTCSPCYLSKCNQPVFCMTTLSAETIFSSLIKVLPKPE